MSKRGKTERNARGAANKRSLSRTRIVDAALAMIDRDGVDAFSMRLLAAELGVTPMALYNHVGGKLELLRNVAGQVLAEIDFDNGAQDWGVRDWRERVAGCFRALRDACLRHPGAARLLEVDGVAPAAVFAPMRVAVAALTGAGLSATDALRAYFTLIALPSARQAIRPGVRWPLSNPARLPRRAASTTSWPKSSGRRSRMRGISTRPSSSG